MPTWLKVVLGCGGVLVLGMIALMVALWFFGRGITEEFGGLEAHEQATETFRRLAREHPFEPPPDGAIGAERAERFIAVTDEVWARIAPSVEELDRRMRDLGDEEREPGLGDIVAGIRSAGRVLEARLALAEALDGERMPSAEYVWAGSALLDAHHALGDSMWMEDVPAENLELARRHAEWLADYEGSDDRLGKDLILTLASMLADPDAVQVESPEPLERSGSRLDVPGRAPYDAPPGSRGPGRRAVA